MPESCLPTHRGQRLKGFSLVQPWLICLTAGLFFFYEFFQLNLFDVINQLLRQDFYVNATELGWMSSAFVWGNVIFLLPAGLLLDRFSPRVVILSALFICILGVLGFGLSHDWIFAAFFHALMGIGNAFCFLSCVVLVSRWFPPQKQAFVIGCIVTMAFLGGLCAHTPFAYLSNHVGWRNAVFVDAGLGLLLWVLIMSIVRDNPHRSNHPSSNSTCWHDLIEALKNPQNIYAGFYTSCLNLPIMVLGALWGNSYLRQVHQMHELAASSIVGFIFIGSIIGCPLVGFLSDKHGGRRKPTMLAGAILTLLFSIIFITPFSLDETALKFLFLLLGFTSSTQVLSYPLIADNNKPNLTGIATALASMLVMSGGGAAQILYGALLQMHAVGTHYTIADFQYAMWIFPASCLMAVFMVLFMREKA